MAAIASLAFVSSAGAAEIVVTTADDDAFGTTGSCSLREAIGSANANGGGPGVNGCVQGSDPDTISFDPSLTGATINLLTGPNHGQLRIQSPMTITGPGMDELTINAPTGDRVLQVTSGSVDVSISGLNIEGGRLAADEEALGGGIRSDDDLELSDVKVTDNQAIATSTLTQDTSAAGGGIYASGDLVLDHVVVSGNFALADNTLNDEFDAYAQGGGVLAATTEISYTTIAGNSAWAEDDFGAGLSAARAFGGGLHTFGVQMDHSTVSGNTAAAFSGEGAAFVYGGAISLSTGGPGTGVNSLELSTVADNRTWPDSDVFESQTGGGITGFGGTLDLQSSTIARNGPQLGGAAGANLAPGGTAMTLANTIVSNPRGGGDNCDGAATTAGYNIDSGDSCWATDDTGDQSDTDPLLDLGAGLADNGGPTKTIAIEPGPALDAGSQSGQAFADEDQRGLDRPVDADENAWGPNADDGTDVGAFEAQPPATPVISATDPDSPSTISTPKLIGTAEAQVSIHTDACSGDNQVSAGSVGAFATPGIPAPATPNATTSFYAQSSNEYSIVSACSAPIDYVHDSLPPVTTIDPGPAVTTDHTPTFGFSATDANGPITYVCSIDAGTPMFAPCTSPITAPFLADGSYTLRVKATDGLGNEEAIGASRAFTVTTPTTTAPVAPTATATVTGERAAALKKCKKKKTKKARKKCKKRAKQLPV